MHLRMFLVLGLLLASSLPASLAVNAAPKPTPSANPCSALMPGTIPLAPPSEYSNVPMPANIPLAPPSGIITDPASGAAAAAQGTRDATNQGLVHKSPCSNPPVECKKTGKGGGSLLDCLWTAANALRGMYTGNWPATNCRNPIIFPDHLGNCACAAAVQAVIKSATGATIGSYNVDGFTQAFQFGGYGARQVPQLLAHKGAIVIWTAHIGFCQVDGCSTTLSNSSSRSTFGIADNEIHYLGEAFVIWEPTHIP